MSLKMETLIPVPNETEASFSRNTCDGRRLTYKLKVLQQPERARACGSGAKSSADRRPVDPPPIVELLIFEGEKADKDITFQMNANYFLFATLEQARPIAQGRVPNDPSRMTVLTGTPVAGMVYLDRPEPAGYFIFPDLSVRHEGKYRLGFSLYEELKRPEDHDQIEDANGSMQGEAHITHRLEVKSQPFQVYSAKKFPGLASSTQLSRTVADQGCRVRIRREARMRRRDKKDYDGYHSDRSRHTTPDLYQQQAHMAGAHGLVNPGNRERSASITSHVSLVAAPVSRRTSGHEMMPAYPQASYPAHVAPQPAPAQSAPVAQPQSQYVPMSPQQQYPPQYMQQPQQQPPPMQPPQMHYQHYQYPQAPAHAPAPQQSYYSYPPAGQHPHYEEQPHSRNLSVDYTVSGSSDSRRPSMAQPPAYPQSIQPHSYNAQYPPTNGYAPQQTPKMRQMSQVSQPSTSNPVSHVLPPINTTLAQSNKIEVSPPSSAVSQPHYYDAGSVNGKRSYDRVFDTRHLNGPLRQGARPSISYGPHGSLLADDGADSELAELENLKMSYRRADGREIARPLPPSHD